MLLVECAGPIAYQMQQPGSKQQLFQRHASKLCHNQSLLLVSFGFKTAPPGLHS